MPKADDVVTALYGSQYRSLVRLAVLLGGNVRAAEEITQVSFVALHAAWPRLRDHDAAVAFLRRAVVTRSRQRANPGSESAQTAEPATSAQTAEPATTAETASRPDTTGPTQPGPDARIMAALRTLPCRQREAVVLRFFLDLPDRQAAAAMGVTAGAVRDHAERAMAALRPVL